MLDGQQGGFVIIGRREFEELVGVFKAGGDLGQRADDVFQVFLFAAQILGVLGVVPDIGVFELGVYDMQPFRFGIVVKDTSEGQPGAPRSLPGGRRVGSGVRLP
ncbi:hypothetical protein HNQ49_003663 [Parapusillimonas granuli]|nr:hypothetical protein [Parapusillimonas granuli]